MIDYPYILVGAIALCLAAWTSSERRDVLVHLVERSVIPNGRTLLSYANGRQSEYCDGLKSYKPTNWCNWNQRFIDRLSDFVDGNEQSGTYKEQDIDDLIKSAAYAAREDAIAMKGNFLGSLWAMIMHNGPIFVLNNAIQESNTELMSFARITGVYSEDRLASEARKAFDDRRGSTGAPVGPDAITGFEAMAELGKAMAWPFVLAIAAALRLTKVTADVLGWAQPDPR